MRHLLPAHIDRGHPVVRQEYAVYTPPIDDMIARLGDWIDQQKPGGYIYGPSRFGKSRGIKWHVRSALEERFRTRLPLVMWLRVPDVQTSEADFWHQLLLAARFRFVDPHRARKKAEGRYLFYQQLVTLARSARSNYVVLLIDEAQDLSLREWKWLVGLQNRLDWDGYRLSVFSIGSHQMGYQHDFMARTGNAHVAARFFVAHTRFHGLASMDELAYVLQGYDRASEWPKGSGVTYLQYFAPQAFARGLRLAECAPQFWQALGELCPPGLDRHSREFPMQHVAQAVESALFHLAQGTEWEAVTSYKSWLNLVAQTEFSDHMRMVATTA